MSIDRMAGSMPIWQKPAEKPELLNPIEPIATTNQLKDVAVSERRYTNERTAGSMHAAELTFGDVLDVVNPLQHIPVVSNLYRKVTGDEIGASARIAGGAIYGGPVGAASSLANAIVAEHSGKDIGDHVMAAFSPSKPPAKPSYTPQVDSRMAGTNPAVEIQVAMAHDTASQATNHGVSAVRSHFNS